MNKVGNATYNNIEDVPGVVPVFPLPRALLLPRAHMPLNIFEPRYIAMIDAALRTDRVIGLVQPDFTIPDLDLAGRPPLCKVGCLGRITAFQESGDGRYLLTLSGVCRFDVKGELEERAPFRRAAVDVSRFASDLVPGVGEDAVDREHLLKTLRTYLSANDLEVDWEGVNDATTETLVNALSLMSPYDAMEKQALLEAEDLKTRADTLIALAEVELARDAAGPSATLQ
ncbi:LON peptidase substrate-binding domain-containing protein [Polycladidibacter hongkongensis]|uniref:LON peptidase substrate-binding domain-containing protein n=1 Tax=Polycladidibacter hongkongensis TaxID=1647556 RepID=UPI00082ACE0D|nr:LON peptidase substrate-binding domain-containing protein [Pseudovibrio hongkongensis]